MSSTTQNDSKQCIRMLDKVGLFLSILCHIPSYECDIKASTLLSDILTKKTTRSSLIIPIKGRV